MAKGSRPTLRLIDRLVLVVAWLVTGGIAYVLGYYVGRGTPERHAAIEERSVRLPVTSTPPAEGQRPKAEREFPSFYQALPAGERPIDVARGTPVTAPPTAGAAPTSVARTTTLAPPTTLARTPPTAPTQTTTVPRAVATTSTTLVRTAPTPPMTVPRAVTATTTPAPSAPPTTLARTATRGGYTVEASPTRSRSEAEQLMATLRRRGYDATLVQVERDGDTWYRLRVGRYPTSEQATDTMRRLRD